MSRVMRLIDCYANNKGADQRAHPRSLISAFIVRCLNSIILLVPDHCLSFYFLYPKFQAST